MYQTEAIFLIIEFKDHQMNSYRRKYNTVITRPLEGSVPVPLIVRLVVLARMVRNQT